MSEETLPVDAVTEEVRVPRKLSTAQLAATLESANYHLQAMRDKCIKLAQQHQDRRFWIHQITSEHAALKQLLDTVEEHMEAETATALRLEIAAAMESPTTIPVGIPASDAVDVADLIAKVTALGYTVLTAGSDEQSNSPESAEETASAVSPTAEASTATEGVSETGTLQSSGAVGGASDAAKPRVVLGNRKLGA